MTHFRVAPLSSRDCMATLQSASYARGSVMPSSSCTTDTTERHRYTLRRREKQINTSTCADSSVFASLDPFPYAPYHRFAELLQQWCVAQTNTRNLALSLFITLSHVNLCPALAPFRSTYPNVFLNQLLATHSVLATMQIAAEDRH